MNDKTIELILALLQSQKGNPVGSSEVVIEPEIRIVILQRGWVMVGYFERKGSDCKLKNASVIRSWGTTKGLGEIAQGGPTSSTKLDPCGDAEFDYLTVVATLSCDQKVWAKKL